MTELMVQNIGLMITNNEEDCIAEVMNEHIKYFDKILVLDGSSDRTEEILRSYPQVKYFIKDKDIIDRLPNRKFEDGARQFLLAKAQELFPIEGWFTLLHGDEIFHDDPNWVATEAEKARAEKVNWYGMNYFLHTSDQSKDLEAISSVQARLLWYVPGHIEIRQFRNKKGISYDLGQRNNVLPRGLGLRIYKYFPIYKHYPYRSVAQVLSKRRQNLDSGFSVSYDRFADVASCFIDLPPGYKVARRFDGSFHEFEIKDQGCLLWRALRGYCYFAKV
ncbi:MAG: glycosyltransferase [Candidatus Margulisbacteria bacterium]|nr:glycosyltransferase [Candidatus Margulisiibacteriota bacterium]